MNKTDYFETLKYQPNFFKIMINYFNIFYFIDNFKIIRPVYTNIHFFVRTEKNGFKQGNKY